MISAKLVRRRELRAKSVVAGPYPDRPEVDQDAGQRCAQVIQQRQRIAQDRKVKHR
jgi:hypothetical protein